MNPYKVLGVPRGASKEEIKNAFRREARKSHPDAPGGSHEKFEEIHAAFDMIKSGKLIAQEGDPTTDAGARQNRYQHFRYTTGSCKGKQSYDDFYAQMHQGKTPSPYEDEDPAQAKRNPILAAMDEHVQAWFRLIVAWSVLFVAARVSLVALFPPKPQIQAAQAPAKQKKPPPPKPLAQTAKPALRY